MFVRIWDGVRRCMVLAGRTGGSRSRRGLSSGRWPSFSALAYTGDPVSSTMDIVRYTCIRSRYLVWMRLRRRCSDLRMTTAPIPRWPCRGPVGNVHDAQYVSISCRLDSRRKLECTVKRSLESWDGESSTPGAREHCSELLKTLLCSEQVYITIYCPFQYVRDFNTFADNHVESYFLGVRSTTTGCREDPPFT